MLNIFQNKKIRDIEHQVRVLSTTLGEVNKKLDRKTSDLSMLSHVAKNISCMTQGDAFLKVFLDIFSQATGAKTVAILLEESGYFLPKEFKNIPEADACLVKIEKNSGLINVIKEAGFPCLREDIYKKAELLANEDVANMRRLNAEAIIPLFCFQELVGMVSFGNLPEKAGFCREDTELLSMLACQMGVSIFNRQFYMERKYLQKELEKKNSDLAIIHRINKVFSSLLDTEKLKELTISLSFEIVDVEKAILFLRDEDEIALVSSAYVGIAKAKEKAIDFEIDNDFIKKLLNNKAPFLIESGRIKENLDRYKCNSAASAVLADSGLVLYIPFISNERVVALLALGQKRSGKDFSADELELLNTFSFQLAIVIENAKLFESVVLDGLTKTYIHRFFQQRLEYEIKIGMRYRTRRTLCLVMVDIDHFKNVNDTYGHQTGDKVLCEVARIMLGSLRTTDIVARYGGDEFAIIMPEVTIKEGEIIAERIRQAIDNFTFLPPELSIKLTASFGIAVYPESAGLKDELINKADKALYKSKEAGRNKVTLCNA